MSNIAPAHFTSQNIAWCQFYAVWDPYSVETVVPMEGFEHLAIEIEGMRTNH